MRKKCNYFWVDWICSLLLTNLTKNVKLVDFHGRLVGLKQPKKRLVLYLNVPDTFLGLIM
jgi:hypothetical protein